jgi:hypothetical protein
MTRRAATITKMFLSLSLATGLLCAATSAPAQTTASVTIPFAFSANNQYVAAGSYKVQLLSDRFLSLRNTRTDKSQVLMVRPESGRVIETQGRLIFQRNGGRNYLKQVWIAGTSVHSELAVHPSHNQELAKQTPQEGSTIEVALK